MKLTGDAGMAGKTSGKRTGGTMMRGTMMGGAMTGMGAGEKRIGWRWLRVCALLACVSMLVQGALVHLAPAQGVTTTTVQGTVYLANGQPGAGTLAISWPAFTTAAGQAVAADSTTVTIPADGFVSVNLTPNQGAMPAGEFYTAVFYMSDGSTSTQYCVVTVGDRNAGRGLTVQNLHCSELARWPNDPGEILAGLRASLAPGAEVVLESTPQGVGGCFYEEWQKAGETGTVRHFFPWWMEPAYCAEAVDAETLSEEERGLMERVPLTLGQIGFRRQIRAGLATLAPQEYAEDAESCFLASGHCFFDLAAIESRLRRLLHVAPEQRHNGAMEVWLPVAGNRKYVVAVDPAGGGSGGDYSAIEVIDRETGMQCAEFAGHVGGLELARLAADIAREYNDAWLVVERNNHGSGVLAYLEAVCRYERVFRQNGQAGWLTNSITRPAALARLGAVLADSPDCLLSGRLLAECRSFVRLPDGSTGAQPGAHDDRVMAMAIALAARVELAGARE